MPGIEDVSNVSIALEIIECSNFCRHCEATYEPRRRHLKREAISAWADDIRQQAERLGVTVKLGYNNSEILDHPEWREIKAEFGLNKFWPAFATNGRQIARDPGLLEELKELGVQWLQLTLGGGSAETHDAFARRHGAFTDIVETGKLAHTAGLHVDWNYIAYRPLTEIGRMAAVAIAISGPYQTGRFDHKGGIDQGIMLVKPQGEGVKMEHLRPVSADLAELPEWAGLERFCRWFGVGCEPESEVVTSLCETDRCVGCLEQGLGDGCWLVACRNGDVYPQCHERRPAYLLGNLNSDGLGAIIERFTVNPPPALAVRRRGLANLAASYGNRSGDKLHNGCSFCRTMVSRALTQESVV